ncbi:cyanophycinase [Tundrisphaera sp. TA3]|uniref:cyanophycinase n=1 Tax=Tundrisphaera sp. TA3 TaxID=3435775 RepID=UPI003EC09AB8
MSTARKPALLPCLALAIALLAPRVAPGDDAPKAGALVIVGGGGMPDNVRDKFMALAGGKAAKLIVIPTASEDADKKDEEEAYLKPWRRYEPANLTLLHTRSREKADTAEFARPIAEATAVWFSGGDQNKIIEAYRGTAVEREFHALLKRGGVLGGTSAGAAIMSDVMIRGGNPVAEVGRGFGFVKNAVVDQHFLKRSRMNRLYGVISAHPELIGIGIDEGTAFIIEGDRWSVVGRSAVLAFEVGKDGQPPRFASFTEGDRGKYPATGLPTPERSRQAEDE